MISCTTINAKNSGEQLSSQTRQRSKQQIFTEPLKILSPKGITNQKLLKLMKAIMPSKSIIGGYLKPLHTITLCNPVCIPKI